MKISSVVASFLGLVTAGSAFAADYTWVYRADVGTSPMNAASWSDPANWDENGVPDSTEAKAVVDLGAATNRYIRLADAVTVYQIKGCAKGHPVLFGENTLTITGTAKENGARPTSDLAFFVPLKLTETVRNAWERFGKCEVAADLTLTGAGLQTVTGAIHFRQDWYANDTSDVRDGLPFEKFGLTFHWEGSSFYGIPALAEAASSTWKLTKGSPFATRVGTVEHALPVGTTVTCGELLPSGTFLKRIFPDGTIELSQNAADDAAEGAVLSFAAFAPKVHHTIKDISHSVNGGVTINLNQYTDEESLRIDVTQLGVSTYNPMLTCSSATGFKTGTLVVHGATGGALQVTVSKGVIEFAGKDAAGTDAGIPNGQFSVSGTANDVIVTNNITATIGTLTSFTGTMNKKGGGTLVLPVSPSGMTGSGTVVVKEGVVTFAEPDDGLPITLPSTRFQIEAGGTLKLPKAGAKITSLPTCADGATIAGPALLVVADALDISSLPLADNVQVVKASQYGLSASEYTWDAIPAATSPLDEGLPVPASWMDASDEASLVTSNGDTQVCLLQWKDVRGGTEDGYPVANAASATLFPQVVTNAAGHPHHVYIKSVSGTGTNNDIGKTHALKYSTAIQNVRAVFKAFNGCGHIICDDPYTWLRPYPNWSQSLFYNGGTYDGIPGTFYVNGEVRAQKSGFPYGDVDYSSLTDKSLFDPVVGEFHFTGSNLPKAACIGWYSGATDGGRNGYERTCEMLIYTNALTFVQRQKICAYLMKKWMHGAEPNQDRGAVEIESFDAAESVPVTVAAGQSMAFKSHTGAGTLVKTGAGDVYVKTLEAAEGGLHVAAGKATVQSTALTRENLPGDPYLHLDASDETTITEGPTAGTIAAMADVRGAGYPVATVVNATAGKYPTLVANAQGELPMVDYGAGLYGGDKPQKTAVTGLTFPETDRLYAAFRTAGGNGGGLISGYLQAWASARGGVLCSVSRTEGGTDYFQKSVWVRSDGVGTCRTLVKAPNSAGGTMFRLDGTNAVPTTAKHPKDSVQLMAMNGYDRIYSDALGCCYGCVNGTYWGGKSRDGETILYTNTLSRASALKVEAYLNKKWFGKETPGLRPAFVGSLAVDAGATLDIVGGAPVTASSFVCAGTVNGAVALADGASITLVVNADGSVTPFGVTGGVDFSQGGTVVLTGEVAALTKGSHAVATALGAGFGTWTVTGEGLKGTWEYRLGRSGDTVVLEAIAPGMLLLVR